ncbi:MAG: type II toxin-antitoxin system PemK/MazF family toxin [Gaiellales bacterium]
MSGDCYRLPAHRGALGREQRGARIGVVVQSGRLHLSTVLVAPASTQAHPAPHRALVDIAGESTRVLIEQIRVVDVERLGSFVARLEPQALAEIRTAIDYTFDR